MSTARRPCTTLALALASGVAASSLLAGPALAEAVPAPSSTAPAEDVPAVAAILLRADGRPTFVEVAAPTVAQAVTRAARLPGSDGVAVDVPMTALATNDPYRPYQWSLDALRADSLPVATDRRAHVVAVVDTGVRATHEDFAPGQVRCELGADFTGESYGACADPDGHGTHVAGIVGAVGGNGKGVSSLAPGTTILPVRVLDSTGRGGSIGVAKGIVHAADRGAEVINLSLGGPGGSSALDAAVQYATDKGALVVVAAGNNRTSGNLVSYPAASPGALSVASTERNGISSSFSYSGPSVDLAAPGGRIVSLSSADDQSYGYASGTSMAAPAVSAAASLYRAKHPAATPAQVTAALTGTATDLEAAGRDHNTGAGLVNPSRLLGTGQPAPAPPVVKAAPPRARVVNPRVARRQAVGLQLADYRPGSSVTVLERYGVAQRVRVRVGGRTVVRTRTTTRTVVLGSFRVGVGGTATARVVPVQSARTGTLLVNGYDRAARLVQRAAVIRVG